jgi:DnaK suppressor protein
MKKKELDDFKKLLIDEKGKILKHLTELSESSGQELDLTTGDSVDIAALEINQNNLTKIGKRESFLLKKIELALEKVNEGSYGTCESCGEQISVARLKARPVAQLCIDCKTEQESMERRFTSKDKEGEGEDDGVFDGEDED